MPSLSPGFSRAAMYLPASTPPLKLFVATTDDLPFQVGMSLSIRTIFTPALIAFLSAGTTAGLVGAIAIPLTPGGDHVLDRRDLAGVVGRALTLREHDLRSRRRLVELLRAVLEREVEADRELRDHSELDDAVRVRRTGRPRCRTAAARRRCTGSLRPRTLRSRDVISTLLVPPYEFSIDGRRARNRSGRPARAARLDHDPRRQPPLSPHLPRSTRRSAVRASREAGSSPTLRPRRMTTTRFAISITWSSACEITITALPSSRSLRIRSSTLSRLAHAERGRRLVEDDDVRRERRGAADGHRLALAARHQPDRIVEPRQRHLQPIEHLAGRFRHRRLRSTRSDRRQPAGRRELAPGVEVVARLQVVEEREILVDGLDSERARIGRRVDRHRRAVHLDRAARRGGARR